MICSIDLFPFGETGFRAHSRFIIEKKLKPFLAGIFLACTVWHASAHVTTDDVIMCAAHVTADDVIMRAAHVTAGAHVISAELYFPLKLGMALQVDPRTISHCLSVELRLWDVVNSSVTIH